MVKYKVTKHSLGFSYLEHLVIRTTVKRFREYLNNTNLWRVQKMKVRITNCNRNPLSWVRFYIGKTFEVIPYGTEYRLKYDFYDTNKPGGNGIHRGFIYPDDCEVITDINPSRYIKKHTWQN